MSVLNACLIQYKEASSVTESPRNDRSLLHSEESFLGKVPRRLPTLSDVSAHLWRLPTLSDVHPFNYTPIKLHIRSDVHPLPRSNTFLVRTSPDWLNWLVNPNGQKFFFRKREKKKHFFFYKKKSLPILLLYPISILSSKVKHNGSIHKYTQGVMFAHYSPLKGWLPTVTFGHNHNQKKCHLSHSIILLLSVITVNGIDYHFHLL